MAFAHPALLQYRDNGNVTAKQRDSPHILPNSHGRAEMKNRILAAAAALALVLGLNAVMGTNAVVAQKAANDTAIATFAGGCFWCIESDFDKVSGVIATVSGYTGGKTDNPTYGQVSRGNTGHREALPITYDPKKVTYAQLLTVFWHSVDPVDAGGQFCDRGVPYQTAVFVHDDAQRKLAEASRAQAMKDLGKKIFTPVETAAKFYRAEEYHQDYHNKKPLRYKYYRWNCGRNQKVEKLWGDRACKGIPKKEKSS
jgi:peptide-methionine (S)-S-oxide reductase